MIVIIDYGAGNVLSIFNMLKKTGFDSLVSNDPEKIKQATKIILPGVGSFDTAMQQLEERKIKNILEEKVLVEKIPLLGICLGMQLLTRESEEGKLKGLGWIAASTYKLPASSGLKVPHMKWSSVTTSANSGLIKDMEKDARFYFVHSYYVQADDQKHVVLHATHGIEFAAAIQYDNIFGVQFHPEKSLRFGMKILSNFASP